MTKELSFLIAMNIVSHTVHEKLVADFAKVNKEVSVSRAKTIRSTGKEEMWKGLIGGGFLAISGGLSIGMGAASLRTPEGLNEAQANHEQLQDHANNLNGQGYGNVGDVVPESGTETSSEIEMKGMSNTPSEEPTDTQNEAKRAQAEKTRNQRAERKRLKQKYKDNKEKVDERCAKIKEELESNNYQLKSSDKEVIGDEEVMQMISPEERAQVRALVKQKIADAKAEITEIKRDYQAKLEKLNMWSQGFQGLASAGEKSSGGVYDGKIANLQATNVVYESADMAVSAVGQESTSEAQKDMQNIENIIRVVNALMDANAVHFS